MPSAMLSMLSSTALPQQNPPPSSRPSPRLSAVGYLLSVLLSPHISLPRCQPPPAPPRPFHPPPPRPLRLPRSPLLLHPYHELCLFRPEPCMSLFFCIFTSSHIPQNVTIDVCQVHGPHALFLQQAAHLTGGAYIHLQQSDALLQYLIVRPRLPFSFSFLSSPPPDGLPSFPCHPQDHRCPHP